MPLTSEQRQLVLELNSSSFLELEDTWERLKATGADVVEVVEFGYDQLSRWQGRTMLLYHLVGHGRTNQQAVDLAIRALKDRATAPRYRACAVLAYSLNPRAIPPLRALLRHPDPETVKNAERAIAAIEAGDHNVFHDGITWVVRPEDDPLTRMLEDEATQRGRRGVAGKMKRRRRGSR